MLVNRFEFAIGERIWHLLRVYVPELSTCIFYIWVFLRTSSKSEEASTKKIDREISDDRHARNEATCKGRSGGRCLENVGKLGQVIVDPRRARRVDEGPTNPSYPLTLPQPGPLPSSKQQLRRRGSSRPEVLCNASRRAWTRRFVVHRDASKENRLRGDTNNEVDDCGRRVKKIRKTLSMQLTSLISKFSYRCRSRVISFDVCRRKARGTAIVYKTTWKYSQFGYAVANTSRHFHSLKSARFNDGHPECIPNRHRKVRINIQSLHRRVNPFSLKERRVDPRQEKRFLLASSSRLSQENRKISFCHPLFLFYSSLRSSPRLFLPPAFIPIFWLRLEKWRSRRWTDVREEERHRRENYWRQGEQEGGTVGEFQGCLWKLHSIGSSS